MRTRIILFIAAFLLARAPAAAAQQGQSAAQSGSVDLGVRYTNIRGDEARFQRFRDLGNGGFLDRFRLQRDGARWVFNLGADHMGRLDQRYFGDFQHSGKVKATFEWDQIPLFISRDTRTLFTEVSPGLFRLPDTIQQGIETARLTIADVVGGVSPLDIRSRRDTATFKFVYTPRPEVDVKFNLKSARRDGTMPYGTTFGHSNLTELPAPVQTRTNDVNAGVEWVTEQGMLRVAYDGSWFDNHVQTLVWDNPWRLTDTTTAGGQGRYALWPDSTLHAVTTGGSLRLPARSRFTGNITVGTWSQDQALLPFTINTAIPVIPLERSTAEAEARTVAMNYNFTSRPSRYLWLNGRFRLYDFDNRTPHFKVSQYVRLDQTVSTLQVEGTEPLGYTRHNLDVDASLTPIPFTAVKVGYGRDWTDRTFRIFERTSDDVFRASIDTTHTGRMTLRAIFERSMRKGTGFDEQALVETGEQPALRHLDIADRDRNRFTALLQATPTSVLGVSVSAAVGQDDYKNSGFGLRDSQTRSYSLSADLTPQDKIAAGLSYTYDRYTALQNSRAASPGAQFTDPTRDWSIDTADRVHTITADLDLLKLFSKTELKFAYNFTRSRAAYVLGVPANSTLSPPVQLPTVLNELQNGTADLRYYLTEKLALGVVYWYDRYNVDDFTLGPRTIDRLDLGANLFLGYVYRPYTANSAWVRLLYFW